MEGVARGAWGRARGGWRAEANSVSGRRGGEATAGGTHDCDVAELVPADGHELERVDERARAGDIPDGEDDDGVDGDLARVSEIFGFLVVNGRC